MGGKALGFEATRLSKMEYNSFCEKLLEELKDQFNFYSVDVVPSYHTKPDFGDVDVVISCTRDTWNKFKEEFKNHEHVAYNGDVFSVGYKLEAGRIAQVDYIFTSENTKEHLIAYDYYSYNDCGNLVGKLAHFIGFKYGHKGLSYEVYNPFKPTQKLHEIYLGESMPTHSIHHILGLDENAWYDGFETLEDMFKWVSKSPFFHPSLYLFDNVNAEARIRDRKRKTYNAFLEWCENTEFNEFTWYEKKQEVRNYYLHLMLRNEVFQSQYQTAMLEGAANELVSVVFNGNVVSEITGLTHRELGAFMQYLKNCGYMDMSSTYIYKPSVVREVVEQEFKNYSERMNKND